MKAISRDVLFLYGLLFLVHLLNVVLYGLMPIVMAAYSTSIIVKLVRLFVDIAETPGFLVVVLVTFLVIQEKIMEWAYDDYTWLGQVGK